MPKKLGSPNRFVIYTPWRRLGRPPYDRLLFFAIEILRIPRATIAQELGVTPQQLNNHMARGDRLPLKHREVLFHMLSTIFLDLSYLDLDPVTTTPFRREYSRMLKQLSRLIHEIIKQERQYPHG